MVPLRKPIRIQLEPRPNFGTILQRCTVVAVSRPSQRPTKKRSRCNMSQKCVGKKRVSNEGRHLVWSGTRGDPALDPASPAPKSMAGRGWDAPSHAHYGSRAHPHRRPGLRLGESSIRNRDMRHQAVVVPRLSRRPAPSCPSPRTYAGVNKGQSH